MHAKLRASIEIREGNRHHLDIWISIDHQTEPIGDTPLCKDGEETGNPYLDATNILIITYNGLTMPHHLTLSHNTLPHTISHHMRNPPEKA